MALVQIRFDCVLAQLGCPQLECEWQNGGSIQPDLLEDLGSKIRNVAQGIWRSANYAYVSDMVAAWNLWKIYTFQESRALNQASKPLVSFAMFPLNMKPTLPNQVTKDTHAHALQSTEFD